MFFVSGLFERGSNFIIVSREGAIQNSFTVDGLNSTSTVRVERSLGNLVNALLCGRYASLDAKVVRTTGWENPDRIGERQHISGYGTNWRKIA